MAPHAAAISLVHLNSVPSTQMRCMITANRRASATIAFFLPRCLAIFIAQAFSQDHLAECISTIWAANAQNLTLPSGLAKIGDKQYTVRTNAMPTSIEALNNIPVKSVNGAWVFVRDDAQVGG
jgi:hypothetical protein